MKNKRILLLARDPGGANTLIPLVGPLRKKGYDVLLFGKDTALDKYKDYGLIGQDIMQEIKGVKISYIKDFLDKYRPDFIITGTSADDMIEKYLWKAAETIKTPSFAILDQWLNYGLRFSNYGVSEIEEYYRNQQHPFLPTKILVMDEYARSEMIKDGINGNRIIITGQPHFEHLHQQLQLIKEEELKQLRANYNIGNDDLVITFASEPITLTYNNEDRYWGYTELSICQEILASLYRLNNSRSIKVIIKQHPKESTNSYKGIITGLIDDRLKNIDIIIDKDSHPWPLIIISNLVLGMSSMFLLEAVIIKKPVLSIQIGLKRTDPFILSRRGLVKTVLDREHLDRELKAVVRYNHYPETPDVFYGNEINRVIKEMEGILNASISN